MSSLSARLASFLAIGIAILILGTAGCSSGVKEVDVGNIDGLRKLAAAYSKATAVTGRPPGKPDDLKPFLPAGEDVNQLLASSRDGQPYVILWGVDSRPGRAGVTPLVIGYEKTGKDGTRFVFLDMGVITMKEDDFAKANFPKGHKPD